MSIWNCLLRPILMTFLLSMPTRFTSQILKNGASMKLLALEMKTPPQKITKVLVQMISSSLKRPQDASLTTTRFEISDAGIHILIHSQTLWRHFHFVPDRKYFRSILICMVGFNSLPNSGKFGIFQLRTIVNWKTLLFATSGFPTLLSLKSGTSKVM